MPAIISPIGYKISLIKPVYPRMNADSRILRSNECPFLAIQS